MTAIPTNEFSVFLPLSKVDYQKRQVWGRATQEVRDGANEVLDYASSVPQFKKWSDSAKQRTALLPEANQSLGNLRVMHSPLAAGKLIDITFNDAEKAIDIGTYISDDDVWKGIINGVYTGFSIGGKYAKRWADPLNPMLTRYTPDPAEISVVDSPAVPTATYKLIKADGSEELRKVGAPADLPQSNETLPTTADEELNPDEGSAPAPDVESVQAGQQANTLVTDASGVPTPDVIDTARVQPITQPMNAPIAKQAWRDVGAALKQLVSLKKADDRRSAEESKLQSLGSRVGVSRREGEPLTAPSGYPSEADAYGDPANWAYPCDSAARCESALAYFNAGKGRSKYSDGEWAVVGRRIANRATAQIGKRYQYQPNSKTIELGKVTKMALNKVELGPLIAHLQQALTSAADEIGSDPQAAQAMLMSLVSDLSSATDTSGVNPDTSTPPPAPTGQQTDADVAALKAAQLDDAPADESAPEDDEDGDEDTPEEAPSDNAMKALNTKFDALLKVVTQLAEQNAAQPAKTPAAQPAKTPAAKVQKNAPAGDLAALLANVRPAPADPVMTALLSGDKYALQKAAAAAGGEGRPDMEAVMKRVNEAVTDSLAPVFTRRMLAHGYNNLVLPSSNA